MLESKTYIAIPPGESIKEQLEYRNMTQKEFAQRMGMSEKHISHLLHGDVQLTIEVARSLEMIFNIPSRFWLKLEANYRDKLQKVIEENDMEDEIAIAKKIPYLEMSKIGWVSTTRNSTDRVIQLRKFFEIANLKLLDENLFPNIAFRRLDRNENSQYSQMVWLQKVKIESRNIEVQPINIQKLKIIIPELRKFTYNTNLDFLDDLRALLASCGICLVCIPAIKGSFLHGATFRDGSKIILGITVRGKYSDRFWFSFFHELSHIILGHIVKNSAVSEDDEQSTDKFAQNLLIPGEDYYTFVENQNFSEKEIINFLTL